MNLVIGNTSQLSRYFPDNYTKISSYGIDLNWIKSKSWSRIYLTMADSRTYIKDSSQFHNTNVVQTLELIKQLENCCDTLVWYSTADLWSDFSGVYNLDTPYAFKMNDYLYSKYIATKFLLQNRKSNTIIHYPVNFNSVYRKEGFLFSKIFKSLQEKQKITVNNLNFHREMVHPKYVVQRSIESQQDEIIGSGRLIYVIDFVRQLYKSQNMDIHQYVENLNLPVIHNKLFVTNSVTHYNMGCLVQDTIEDLQKLGN